MMLRIAGRSLLFLLLFLAGRGSLMAQKDDASSLNNTFKRKNVSHASTHKHLAPIYKHSGQNRMYTNDCVHDLTAQMGFEYVILTGDCEKALGGKSGMEIDLHNFMVGTKLFFTRGPFWKHKVKKRYKFCKERMGDVVE